MRDAANLSTDNERARTGSGRSMRRWAFGLAVLGLATCTEVSLAPTPAPMPMQSVMATSIVAALPTRIAPVRSDVEGIPSAVPVTAPKGAAAAANGDSDPALAAASDELEAPQPPPDDRFREIFWTAQEPATLASLAVHWGLQAAVLAELNPELSPDAKLAEGTRLRVYRHDPERPTISMGSPNRGKLRNGMPLPEGPAWRLRPVRHRVYGATHTISALVQAFEVYGEQHPEGPKIRVGEIAKRGGGRVAPHSSHRSGRDVDIGYIAYGADDGENRWPTMSERNFDAEKNWTLIKAILDTGQVQSIYVSKKLQKLLHREAAKHLGAAELASLFEYPRTAESPRATIQHWRGHSNHMHVRFKCEADNRRCRARGA